MGNRGSAIVGADIRGTEIEFFLEGLDCLGGKGDGEESWTRLSRLLPPRGTCALRREGVRGDVCGGVYNTFLDSTSL